MFFNWCLANHQFISLSLFFSPLLELELFNPLSILFNVSEYFIHYLTFFSYFIKYTLKIILKGFLKFTSHYPLSHSSSSLHLKLSYADNHFNPPKKIKVFLMSLSMKKFIFLLKLWTKIFYSLIEFFSCWFFHW